MNTIPIRLYDLFRKEFKFPDEKAVEFVGAVQKVVEFEVKTDKQLLASKEDIYNLKMEVKDDMYRLEIKLYKAMFLSGLVKFLAILGGMMALFKFFK